MTIQKETSMSDFLNWFDGVVMAQPKDVASFLKSRGFEITHTGGGFLAYERKLDDGSAITITDEDGSELPQALDERIWISMHNRDAYQIFTIGPVDLREAAMSAQSLAEFGRRLEAADAFERGFATIPDALSSEGSQS
jgi:hypothetical protein